MAQPLTTTVGSWEAENATVAQVEAALNGLRKEEQRAAVRTSVLNFVVVIDERDQAGSVLEVVRHLGGRHPSRAVVIVLADGDGSGMDACAALHCAERDGRSICFEDVVLDVRGRARWHLDSVVEPLTLPDLPVAVWLPSRLPSPGDPLLAVADRVIIDSRFLPATAEVLRSIAVLARRFPVADLSWLRLAPWRDLLAGLFDGSTRPFVRGVHRAEVAGNFGPRHLLGGWLATSLALPPAGLELRAAEHVSVRLHASAGGRDGRFTVERRGDDKLIDASVEIAGSLCQHQTVRMRDQSRSQVLADALGRMGRDVTYQRSLFGALELLR